MTEGFNFAERYRATLFVCALHSADASIIVVRGWDKLATALAPHFAQLGAHGETNADRARRVLAKAGWDLNAAGLPVFLHYPFQNGDEAFILALVDGIPLGSADWVWLARDPETPLESITLAASRLRVGEVVEVQGGVDVAPAFCVLMPSTGKPSITVCETRAEAEAVALKTDRGL